MAVLVVAPARGQGGAIETRNRTTFPVESISFPANIGGAPKGTVTPTYEEEVAGE